MADAFLFADVRRSHSDARVHRNVHLVLALLAPALLLGIWRAWTSAVAPRMDVYFSAEVVLIVYAYFAVVRAVHVHTRSYDRAGRYSRRLALKAAREFWQGAQRYWSKMVIVGLSLLVAALGLDVLTAHAGIQHRPNVHLTILLVEIMVWARYGPAIVVASARWLPPTPPAFAEARELADKSSVARSFALVSVGYGLAAFVAVVCYKRLGLSLPTTRAELVSTALFFTGLAMLALWLQCRWAQHILPQLEDQPALDAPALVMQRAA